jgi:hypothetical protein
MNANTRFQGPEGDENGGELYRLLPAVIRQRDPAAGQPLRRVLADFGSLADEIEQAIEDGYDDFFVETCSLNRLAFIADLLDYRPVIENEPAKLDDGEFVENGGRKKPIPFTPCYRRGVAKTIWARKRKGTSNILGSVVRALTGLNTIVFENNRITAATQSIRYAGGLNTVCSPDFRAITGRDSVDRVPGLVPRIPTMRRVDTNGTRGRWHPLDVVVVAWSPSDNGHGTDDRNLVNLGGACTAEYVPIESRFGIIYL